jgi:hypothetical protein
MIAKEETLNNSLLQSHQEVSKYIYPLRKGYDDFKETRNQNSVRFLKYLNTKSGRLNYKLLHFPDGITFNPTFCAVR